MKKIIGLLLLVIILSGCNKEVLEFQYDFDKVICNYDGSKFQLEIDKWTDYDGEQIQVRSNGKTYLLSTNKCYMIRDN